MPLPSAARKLPTGAPFSITIRLIMSIFGALMVLTTAWAFATPLMAVPDEPAHVVRAAAVARGELIGTVSADDADHYPEVEVPKFIQETYGMKCFAGNPTLTADCQKPVSDNDESIVSQSSAAFNSPIYYAIVGLPSLIMTGAPALYAMRLVSALLFSLLATTTFVALLAQSRSWWPTLGAIVALTPMAFFLGGSINPNAVEMAAAAAVLSISTLFLRERLSNASLWTYGALAVASSFLLTGGRVIGILWLALIAITAILVARWSTILAVVKRRAVLFTLAGMAAAAVTVVAWVAYSGSVTNQHSGVIVPRAPGLRAVVISMFENTFDYWSGWIGQFGWIDYAAPAGVQAIWHAAIIAVLFCGLVLTKGRTRVALLFVTVATVVVPPAIQTSYYNEIGWMWQGRYSLALYTCCLIMAGIALDHAFPTRGGSLGRKVLLYGVGVLASAQVATFVFVLRRYVVGSTDWDAMFRSPLWQPPLGWIGLTAVTCLGWAWGIYLLWRATRDQQEPSNDGASLRGHSREIDDFAA